MRVLELYSGIGGMHLALKGSTIGKKSEVVTAIEISPTCNDVYKFNFPETTLLQKNLCSLSASEVNRLNPDIVLMSPPCQPFTRQGNQKDMEDERNISLLNFIELLPLLTSVSYILLENVKGFEESETRKRLLATLHKCNYTYDEFLLNPRQFKICNSRTRYYLLAKRLSHASEIKSKEIKYDVPQEYKDSFKNYSGFNIPSTISEILEYHSLSNEWNEYSLPNEYVDKYFDAMDIVTRDDENSCCFTGGYFRYSKGTGSMLTILSRNEFNHIENNIPHTDINKLLHLRYFTPNEIARVMMFPKEFKFPEHITKKQRYKMLCNSINIYVVSFLISYLTDEFVL